MTKSATFDSNVWRKIVSPASFPSDPDAAIYQGIHDAVKSGKLKGFLADAIFHLEVVPKKMRPEYFGKYQPEARVEVVGVSPSGEIHMRCSIGPSSAGHPGNSDYPKRHLNDAIGLGVLLLSAPRIGTPRNPDIRSEYYAHRTEAEMAEQQALCGQVFETINELGAGIAHAKSIGDSFKNGNSTWVEALANAPADKRFLVSKAIAEWVDGDSIAAHVSHKIDYYCTLDFGISAGEKSVLAPDSRKVLQERYGIRFVTPKELHGALYS